MTLQERLNAASVRGAIHHAWLQLLKYPDKKLEMMVMRGLAELKLKKFYGFTATEVKNEVKEELRSGAFASVEEYSRGTQTIVPQVRQMMVAAGYIQE